MSGADQLVDMLPVDILIAAENLIERVLVVGDQVITPSFQTFKMSGIGIVLVLYFIDLSFYCFIIKRT
jgi:hypothetical protein